MCRQQRSADSRAAAAAGGGMLTMSSRNYDYDYDAVQPYFLLDGEEEDFYLPPRSQLLPGPGEDIWKKFELLPTPPLSPSRRPSPPDALLSAAQHLEAVSDLLEDDRDPAAALLQSFVIQDCMWSSSFAAATKLEKVVSERLASLRARRDSATAAERQPGGSRVNAGYLQDLHAAAADCIDPSAVLPYAALSESSAGGAETEELCPDSPPLSGSDSESEEEDEEGEGGEEEVEEEEEEEEEEIDVVTVVKRRVSRRSAPSSRALVLKRSHINIHQHNYAAQQPAGVKRLKPEGGGGGGGGGGAGRRCCSPRSDGGGEGVKRRTHNVLERQRRTELTRSFAALRDQIPALSDNHKAAKVSILKTATEFVWEVGADERRLLTTKSELRKRSRALRHRLEQLRTLR